MNPMLSLVLTLVGIVFFITFIFILYYYFCLKKKVDTNMLLYSEELI
jgi:hypothetical protein